MPALPHGEPALGKAPTTDTAPSEWVRGARAGFQDPHPRCSPLQAWDGAWGRGLSAPAGGLAITSHSGCACGPGTVPQGSPSQWPQTSMETLGRVLAAGVRDSGCGDGGGGRTSPADGSRRGQIITPPGPGRLAGQLPGPGCAQTRSRRAFRPRVSAGAPLWWGPVPPGQSAETGRSSGPGRGSSLP